MTTIVAVKKNGYATIAADTLSLWGNMKESAEHIVNHEKILKFQDNYLGFTDRPRLNSSSNTGSQNRNASRN
jgi:hypothetical protein